MRKEKHKKYNEIKHNLIDKIWKMKSNPFLEKLALHKDRNKTTKYKK